MSKFVILHKRKRSFPVMCVDGRSRYFSGNVKIRLALDTYQIRFSKEIQRYWLLMSLAHCICVTGTGKLSIFSRWISSNL